jgi:hypothetical protein
MEIEQFLREYKPIKSERYGSAFDLKSPLNLFGGPPSVNPIPFPCKSERLANSNCI